MPAPQGGIGSGVIIDESGIILTNNHVVAGDGEISVRTHDGANLRRDQRLDRSRV